jgi:hypothetical protein
MSLVVIHSAERVSACFLAGPWQARRSASFVGGGERRKIGAGRLGDRAAEPTVGGKW